MPQKRNPKKKVVKYMINGFPATIRTWTTEEWDKLQIKPFDAQRCDNGVYVAFRMD